MSSTELENALSFRQVHKNHHMLYENDVFPIYYQGAEIRDLVVILLESRHMVCEYIVAF